MLWVLCMRALLLALLATGLGACSADAAEEPEPTIDTPGAFVAVQSEEGPYLLHRTLSVLLLETGEELLFATVYAAQARDFAEARELAQEPDLPKLRELEGVLKSELTSRSWKVVWFRTLTDEELDVIL